MIKGIGHTAYNVKNMERSLDFYCNILGFKKAFEIDSEDGRPWIVYIKVAQGQFIELFYGGENQPLSVEKPIGYSHICLEVDDINAIAEHLKANGIKLDVEPKQGKDLNYQCWTKDPDGNRIEFMQMNPQSLQSRS